MIIFLNNDRIFIAINKSSLASTKNNDNYYQDNGSIDISRLNTMIMMTIERTIILLLFEYTEMK